MSLEAIIASCPRQGQRIILAESEDVDAINASGRWIASDTLWEVVA